MSAISQNKRAPKSKADIKWIFSPKSESQEGGNVARLFSDWKMSFLMIASGITLGFSAPGFDQWYLAWFAIAPLMIGIAGSCAWWQALLRGFLFGFAYNAVYWSWLFGLQPLDWLGFGGLQGSAMSLAAVAFISMLQGSMIAIFAGIIRLLPTTGTFIPAKSPAGWRLPAITLAPALWVLLLSKLLNAHSLLGVPWSMVEYSQYKQLPLIQMASITGGIGIGFLMVMCNTAIAASIGCFLNKKQLERIAAPSRQSSFIQLLVMALLVCMSTIYGQNRLACTAEKAAVPIAVLQGNINIEMQKTKHRYTVEELLGHYCKLIEKTSPSLLVWTESALPAYLPDSPATEAFLSDTAKAHHSDMIVGAIDLDDMKRPYNSAFGITSGGSILVNAYHKRYLVPFGEYAPTIVQCMPECVKQLTNTPAGGGFEAGKEAGVLDLNCGHVGPLICFECLSPELVAASVRHGAEFLVNISDLAWFHRGICGEQMLAFSVFRAIENDRYFVFAANTGPSAVIEPTGKLQIRCDQTGEQVLSGKVNCHRDKTVFTQWFTF